MGFYTPNAQVWYPAPTDTGQLDTLLATMASSIENGIQPRLAKQELTKSLLATVLQGSTWGLANGVEATMPFTVNAGNYNNGMNHSGSTYITTIETPGLYNVSVSCLAQISSGYVDLRLYKNAGVIGRSLGASTSAGGGFAPASVSQVMQYAAGDTIKSTITVNGVAASASIHTGQATYNVLSITLVKAL